MTRRPPPIAGRVFRVPGRIEVLGKHVDYAGGRSLLCATSQGFAFEVRGRADGVVRLHDRVSDQRATLPGPESGPESGRADGGPASGGRSVGTSRGPVWAKYPRAVVERVRADFPEVAAALGCDIVFSSELPSAAGLSSSSAFTTGVLLSLDAASGFLDTEAARRAIRTPADLADYAGAIESGRRFEGLGPEVGSGVGVRGGSQDHTAILCSRRGELLQASFAPVRLERYVALPSNLWFVIGVSGVRASKSAGARGRYNRLSDLATRIAELWRAATGGDEPHLGAILASAPDAVDRLRAIVEEHGPAAAAASSGDAGAMIRRIEQFRIETTELVPGVVEALRSGDRAALGDLVATSQRLAETHLGNQVPETMHLAASAREAGAVAASAFGAGFGGAVWALVERGGTDDFVGAWRRAYGEAFPDRASRARFVATDAADPASPLPSRFVPDPGA